MKQKLLERINEKTATIAVAGLGYAGLPLIKRFNEVGFNTIGLDIDQTKVDALINGEAYIRHIAIDDMQHAIQVGKSIATTDFSRSTDADVIILCIPTPLNKYREPDLGFVTGSVETLLPHLRKGQMLSLESTTYPGTTEEELKPRIEQQNLAIGEDFFLVYSPEREDPGNPTFSMHSIPKLCGGITGNCLDTGQALYSQIFDKIVPVSSARVAEMTKILENTYRAVNIALVNELKVVADKMGIDIFEVIDAAATKPFGYKAFYPGPGLGGHCIPIDPFYLTWKAREYGLHTRFIELAGEINKSMPDYVIGKVTQGLNQVGKSVCNSRILVLGVAYKKNVGDVRESPGIELLEKLRDSGACMSYHDPFVPRLPKMRDHDIQMESSEVNSSMIRQYDCVVIVTDHDNVDYALLSMARLVVDTRGVFREPGENTIRA